MVVGIIKDSVDPRVKLFREFRERPSLSYIDSAGDKVSVLRAKSESELLENAKRGRYIKVRVTTQADSMWLVYEGIVRDAPDIAEVKLGFIEQIQDDIRIWSNRNDLKYMGFSDQGIELNHLNHSHDIYDPESNPQEWSRAYQLLRNANEWKGDLILRE